MGILLETKTWVMQVKENLICLAFFCLTSHYFAQPYTWDANPVHLKYKQQTNAIALQNILKLPRSKFQVSIFLSFLKTVLEGDSLKAILESF